MANKSLAYAVAQFTDNPQQPEFKENVPDRIDGSDRHIISFHELRGDADLFVEMMTAHYKKHQKCVFHVFRSNNGRGDFVKMPV